MQLWKHPNGTWYVRFGPRLRQRVSSRTKDRKAAEIFFSQFVAAESGLTPDDPNMGAILEAYQADRAPCVRSKKTLEGSVKVLQRHFKDLKPKHLNPAVIRKFAVNAKLRTARSCAT